MKNVYVVTYHTWNSEYRNHEDGILRIYGKLEDAMVYLSEIVRLPVEDINAMWSEGYLDYQYWDRVYCIEECVLKE